MADPTPGQFNGPENELVSAGLALGASFVALLILAILVHPQILGGGEESAPGQPTPASKAKPTGPR